MNYPRSDDHRDPHSSPYQEQFRLTPEEQKVLNDCTKQGIIERAIPGGIIFGIGAYLSAKAGPLMHKKYGAKPAVIGFGFLGYMIGRFSYAKTCMLKVLEVPDGNLRKLYPHLDRKHSESEVSPENFYATVDVAKDQDSSGSKSSRNSVSDGFDIAPTSSFDTVPSDYYEVIDEQKDEEQKVAPPRSYNSYDDMRKQNRQDYMNKLYPQTQNHRRPPEPPIDVPPVRRRTSPQDFPQEPIGGHKTKYGDVWD